MAKRKKKTSSKKLLKIFLLVSFLVLFWGGVFKIALAWKGREWKENARFTVVIQKESPKIYSYDPKAGELLILTLPENFEAEGALDIGKWKAESLYELGNQRGLGGQLLRLSLQNAFGIPIDGWSNGGKTSLDFFDNLRFSLTLAKIPKSSQREISAQKLGLVQKDRLGDGSMGWKATDTDTPTREFADLTVAKEAINVGIINSSQVSGLGKRVARIVETLGAPVLWVRTQDKNSQRCVVKAQSKVKGSLAVGRLVKIFDCTLELEDKISSQVELILGEKIAPEFPEQ